jgi:NTP pyrophosphatase (non-canonical NTP hydrolase)
MTINEYQKEALRTASGLNNPDKDEVLLNGVMGLCGESGECADMVKKYLFQGHELDKSHLAKELGDVAWYLAVASYAIGFNLETVLQMNVDKLRSRYPDGFEAERSLHRKEGDV